MNLNTVDLIVKKAMAECDDNRDRAIALLILRKNDVKLNEQFRVLGIKQAVRSAQTDARSPTFERGRSTTITVPERGAPTRRPVTRDQVDSHPTVRAAQKAVDDIITSFMRMHTLFGGQINLAHATRPDFVKSAASYGSQEAGAKKKRLFHTACAEQLPKGSITAVLKASQYPRVFQIARDHGIIDGA